MTKQYRSDALASLHETMEALQQVGAIDKRTLRRFDDACLTPVRIFAPAEIRALREREQVSQSVFEHHLNVQRGLVSKWERGDRQPAGPSLKLLALVEKNGLAAIA